MNATPDTPLDRRLLFLATTNRDAVITAAKLSALGIGVTACSSFGDLLRELQAGAGAVLMPEEAATSRHNALLHSVLASQPPWSDLPVLILTRPGADSAETGDAVRLLGNVTLLERPVRLSTLASAVQSALRARDRQYQIREYLAERTRGEDALRRADQRKDEFLATLGHELRNPLAPLLTAVQLLKAAGPHEPVAARVQPVMERQVSHLVRLVNDLLEVSRITRGLIEVQREPIDLGFVVQSAIETSRPVIDSADHHLTVELPREPIIVRGDTIRLTQVFANLLNNAAKYTDTGGHISVSLSRQGARAVVIVRDDGIGIPAPQLTSVFDMFTQVDRSNRLAQGGLGIGLTLVRSLVEMHGGQVDARSDGAGSGSEFIVSLPVAPGEVQRASSSHGLEDFPPRRRILIVDDNADAADMLGELLKALGASVSVARSGREALNAVETFAPDVAVLDIGMPEMDGYEVARRIRSRAPGRVPMLIALTGWGQECDQDRSRAAGFDHHMVKPLDVAKLRELLTVSAGA